MIGVTDLLLPALVAAVLVFLASSVIHMLTPWHAGDFNRLPDEDAVLAALRPFSLAPGQYVGPRPSSMKDMGTPEFQAKLKAGPSVMLNVMPSGNSGMGAQLASWFVYSFLVALFAGWVTSKAFGRITSYMIIFKFVGVITFAALSIGLWQMSIWYRRPWLVTIKNTIDGLIYAGLTAGAFGWLWPRP